MFSQDDIYDLSEEVANDLKLLVPEKEVYPTLSVSFSILMAIIGHNMENKEFTDSLQEMFKHCNGPVLASVLDKARLHAISKAEKLLKALK